MVAQPIATMTEAEYLEFERASETKHEFYDGQIYAMAGASLAHGRIIRNTSGTLFARLQGTPCEVITNDLRVQIGAARVYTYPDLVVLCGEPQLTDDSLDTLLNPVILIEVLSPSTESHDRGAKWVQYQQLESLREYLLISQTTPRIDHYVRQDDGGWRYTVTIGLEASIELPSIGCTLAPAEIYENVAFG